MLTKPSMTQSADNNNSYWESQGDGKRLVGLHGGLGKGALSFNRYRRNRHERDRAVAP